MLHIPVLKKEVEEIFAPKQNEDFIDATIGLGGHAEGILQLTAPKGKLLAIDWDEDALEQARINLNRFGDRVFFQKGNYRNIAEYAQGVGIAKPKGILLDLGLGSWQLDDPKYGISFRSDAPLDMRFENEGMSVAELLKRSSIEELSTILKDYGDEPKARTIAEKIVKSRKDYPIKTVKDLVDLVESVKPRFGKIHPATQTLQAFRIVVNREQENLKEAIKSITEHFPNTILAIISFHSGEDRIVKNLFKQDKFEVITKKPISPTFAEIRSNPRSRSAKLRVAKIK